VQLFPGKQVFGEYIILLLKHKFMRRGIILTAIFLAISCTAGMAAGQSVVKETRDVKGFTKVSFGVSGNMYISIGSEFKVVLEGDRDDLDEIITEVTGGKLVVKKENWRFNMNEKVNVYITMPEIEGLGVSGSGRAEIKDAVKSNDLNLSVSGSGKLYTGDIAVNNLDCSISGSGDIIVGGGNASSGDLSISGSGNYNGENAKIASADVSISGSGNCLLNVTESLTAHVSGSGNVTYTGGAPKVDARVSGSGKVRSR
jgi:hypothetical protein